MSLDISGRWWLFAFDEYYPCGGMSDFRESFHELEPALRAMEALPHYDYMYVLDSRTGGMTEEGGSDDDTRG